MPRTMVSRISADLVGESDRPRIEAFLATLAASDAMPTALVEQIAAQVQALSEGRDLLVFDKAATLTTTQAAQQLGCSRPHVIKLCDRGELEFELVGRDRRIPVTAVESFIKRRAAEQEKARQLRMAVVEGRDERVAAAAGLTLDEARSLGL